MNRQSYLHRAGLGLLAAAGVWCAASYGPGQGFDVNFADNRPGDVGAVAADAAAHGNANETDTPFVVLTPPPPAHGLTAVGLPSGRHLWQVNSRIDARPWIAGDTVVSHAGSEVVGYEAGSGRERFRFGDQGYSLIGAGGDRHLVAITLGPGGLGRRHGHLVIVDPTSGSKRYEKEVEQALGAPTAVGGYAFVPWNAQYLSIIDVANGRERARIRSLDDVLGRANHEGGAVYFGARALYRFSSESGRGRRQGSQVYSLPREDLPGSPTLLPDGYAPVYAGINARERVSVVLRPDPRHEGVRLVDGSVYVIFHRVIFGLDARSGAVRWSAINPADIVGAEVVRGGLLIVDERGEAAMIDTQRGRVVWHQSLGAPAVQAVIRAPIDFSPPRNGADPPQEPVTTLLATVASTDDRLLPARMFSVRALATMPEADATAGLLDVTARSGYPQALRASAGEALARRTQGIDSLLAALEAHYDYLRQTSAPPVGFIARALAHAHESRGVALLIAHLSDPETPAADLPPLVAALKDLGDSTAVPALLDFVRLYHADDGSVPPVIGDEPINDRSLPEQEALDSALELAIQAIVQLGTPSDRRWVEYIARDPNTLSQVRSAIARAMPRPEQDTQAPTADVADAGVDPNVPPVRVTREMIQDAFAPTRDAMLHCLDHATSRPSQVRLEFRYDGSGTISSVAVVPSQYTACMAPIATGVHLPPSQVSREIGSYYLLGEVP